MVMRKFFTALVLIPLGLLFVVFAVANRHLVTVSFDPFNSSDLSVGFTLPLFVVIIAVAIAGVVAGGSATWFRQRHWRRACPRRRRAAVMGQPGETSRARRCRTRPASGRRLFGPVPVPPRRALKTC